MDSLDRMFQTLVKVIQVKQPALLSAPFTVGDIHQHLLPYRHYRRELGLETNQEYELLLMELLSGARAYLDVDERLRDELGKELVASSPEPSRVRDFADAHVTINPAALSKVQLPRLSLEVTPRTSATVPRTVVTPGGTQTVVGTPVCRYCGGDLPLGRPLHFCPNCGENLQVKNCPACGSEIEAGWKFCVACGKAVS